MNFYYIPSKSTEVSVDTQEFNPTSYNNEELNQNVIQVNINPFDSTVHLDPESGLIIHYYANGKIRYKGEWSNDCPNGNGVMYYEDNSVAFEGKWRNGIIEVDSLHRYHYNDDSMEVFYEDGSLKYYGGWKNGSAYGQGKYYLKNGKLLIDGEWSFGVYYPGNGDTFLFDTGFIIKYKNDNIVYIGGVKEGLEPDGTGLQFDDDKSILYSGHSKNGRYDGIGVNKRKKYIQLIGKWEDDISNQHGKYLIC